MRLNAAVPAAVLACLAGAAAPALAADASVEARLSARGLDFESDDDGDYKVVFAYDNEGRSQLVFISGSTTSVRGMTVREVFAPAGRVQADGIDGKRALELLADSRLRKIGSWELAGDVLYFVIKLPDNVDAATLEAAIDVAAQTADDMEIELSGDRDAL